MKKLIFLYQQDVAPGTVIPPGQPDSGESQIASVVNQLGRIPLTRHPETPNSGHKGIDQA